MYVKSAFAALAVATVSIATAMPVIVPKPTEMRVLGGICRGAEVKVERDKSIPAEGYRLCVSERGISIRCSDGAGETYARQTLRQLELPNASGVYRCVEIYDVPKYRWRGLMLDDARHFFGRETVKAFIDRMVEHKFNVFHWHLVDDQGWRLELKNHPELVEVMRMKHSFLTTARSVDRSAWEYRDLLDRQYEQMYPRPNGTFEQNLAWERTRAFYTDGTVMRERVLVPVTRP